MHNGLVMLDLDCNTGSMDEILTLVSAKLTEEGLASEEDSLRLKDLWMQKHRHQFEGPRKEEGNLSAVIKELLVQKLESKVMYYRLK